MKIHGTERMSPAEVEFEVQHGGRFVYFLYCISLLVITFKRPSDIYFLRAGENAVVKGLPFTLLSLVAGWWGIPWGPIYTVQSVHNNLSGGKDVTQSVMDSARKQAAGPTGPTPPS